MHDSNTIWGTHEQEQLPHQTYLQTTAVTHQMYLQTTAVTSSDVPTNRSSYLIRRTYKPQQLPHQTYLQTTAVTSDLPKTAAVTSDVPKTTAVTTSNVPTWNRHRQHAVRWPEPYRYSYTQSDDPSHTGTRDSSVVRAPDSRLKGRGFVSAGTGAEFSSPGSTFCADSYFGIRSTPVLPQ